MIRVSSFIVVVALLCFSTAATAQEYTEGTHYTKTANASPARRDGKIDVVEVFSYLCPHCNTFQSYVNNWHNKMPENVNFSRVPVIFQSSWQPYAVSYYTAETMGILDQAHPAMFNAIHRERKQFRSMDDLAEFYAQFGVSAEQFTSTASSFAVDSKLRKGVSQTGARGWGVQSTPTLIVAGKYRVTASRSVPQAEILKVVDFLVAKETAIRAEVDTTEEAVITEEAVTTEEAAETE
jgi:thiol:disulfide interchange protein DsbA